ncbi:MAG TPA: response regulator, partial [Alcanivorax sp.]|nr:response regulator [Alcanivorax sp.]
MTTATSGLLATTSMESVVHLVDQDPRSRDRIIRVLRTGYLPCRSYRDADDFLTHLDDDRPGCILVTLRAPGMTGLRTQQRLSGTGSTLSIIFLGDSPPLSAAVDAMRAGAEDFLTTPTDDETLIETVQKTIAR